MQATIDVGDALDLKNLPDAPGFKVLKVTASPYENWDHEESLRVDVVIDDSVDFHDKDLGKKASNLKSAIRENLRQRGISLFAYIYLATPSELAETDEE